MFPGVVSMPTADPAAPVRPVSRVPANRLSISERKKFPPPTGRTSEAPLAMVTSPPLGIAVRFANERAPPETTVVPP